MEKNIKKNIHIYIDIEIDIDRYRHLSHFAEQQKLKKKKS